MPEPQLARRGRGLAQIKDILDAAGIPFIVEGGVLLGAVREGDFLPWDNDVDVAVRSEDLVPRAAEVVDRLARSGFQARIADPDPRNFKIAAAGYDTHYEVCGWFLRGRWRRRRHYKMPAPFFDRTTTVRLHGVDYPCPDPPVGYLEFFYGDWRTPRRDGRSLTYRCFDLGYLVTSKIRRTLGLR
jgi:hypothetical protein